MVASAVRMRTPSAMFLSRGAASMRRPQVSYKFQEVLKSQMPAISAISRFYASKSFPPHTIICMPALSPTMTAGNVGAWQKKAGDTLAPGDVLVEIETDKAQMDFEFQEEGVLAKVLKETGEKDVAVGSPIAVLVEEGCPAEKEAPKSAEPSAPTPAPEPAAEEPETSGEKLQPSLDREPNISYAAKALALEKGVPLKAIKGTGKGGQITKEDVQKYQPAATSAATFEDLPVSSMRKTIANRLKQSMAENPHYFVSATLSVTKLLKLRQALNASADGKYKLSVNDFLVKACAAALMKVPQVNSSWIEENGQAVIRQHNTVDISVAVSTPTGLITPVVKGVQGLGLSSISNQVRDLGKRARDNKLKPEEYQAVAVPVETAEGTVTEWDEQIVVTGSFDHKVVDGAVGGEWIKELKKVVENPLELLL
ncbi:Dihydrolipoyllysine-residue acetyltransferase component of pyruvate dehydrogenase complex [Penicillium maclennaniae]|uniref:Dihydrolipoyllysine-residue acetyltransferase component of pyruvate dehydrogenase complex n=1 Tax=Penicillium maclennaniae TaxID=1343394 RepID=UPI002541049A|nr:Dihydrolipoyllysine-residue acetyltransferase component of pyruvate dehydrogenase complex [Penicillium maclennaniae]KAJ5661435.1 Dihydrolipoyllysine-residue acetyltransferase component of pyruvate dehydrogenase complex [Penicillium maclennaniae]